MRGDRNIQVVHVSLVVLVVVQVHGLGIEARLKRLVGVRECRQLERPGRRSGGGSRSLRGPKSFRAKVVRDKHGAGNGAHLQHCGSAINPCHREIPPAYCVQSQGSK